MRGGTGRERRLAFILQQQKNRLNKNNIIYKTHLSHKTHTHTEKMAKEEPRTSRKASPRVSDSPTVTFCTSSHEDDALLQFTLENVDVSIANAIRRTILSNIETVVFRTSPHERNDCVIHVNNTKLNNEIIKHRLSCIPIHYLRHHYSKQDIAEMRLEVNVHNTSATYRMVTTQDFQIRFQGKLLPKDIRDKIFPRSATVYQKLGKEYYIDFVKLRPQMENVPGEHLHLECAFSFGKASEDGMFNVVSTCSYGFTKDQEAAEKAANAKRDELGTKGLSEDEINFQMKDWWLLDSFRHTKPNSFDFVVESIGVYNNKEIVARACAYLIRMFKSIQKICAVVPKTDFTTTTAPENQPKSLETLGKGVKQGGGGGGTAAANAKRNDDNPDTTETEKQTALHDEYLIYVNEDEYTLGKVLERFLYQKYFEERGEMTFCGFRKAHPHDTFAIIQLYYKDPVSVEEVRAHLQSVAEKASDICFAILHVMNPSVRIQEEKTKDAETLTHAMQEEGKEESEEEEAEEEEEEEEEN